MHRNIEEPNPPVGHFLDMNSGQNMVMTFSLENTVATNAVLAMPMRERMCVGPGEYKLQHVATYSASMCVLECKLQYILKSCKCLPYMYGKWFLCKLILTPRPTCYTMTLDDARLIASRRVH